MANTVQFSVDDTSPAVAYSPFADTFTFPDLSAGWNPYFVGTGFLTNPGQTGNGLSQHITSRNNASVSISWHGTSIQLFGNTTSQATFALTLDGASVQPNQNQTNSTLNLLASLDGLPNTNHSLTLTAHTPEVQDPPDSSLLVFDKAVITTPAPTESVLSAPHPWHILISPSLIFSEHPLDDKDVEFLGQWIPIPSSGQPSLLESQSQGDSAQTTFSGTSSRLAPRLLVFSTCTNHSSPSANQTLQLL
ncbi:hypothetical protein P691DRAFT_674052 [Macrolepiota fuliginosa MF-IS2]|uniref:Uncharacterized protein n=1 Tax=Macrolepiota fuliginosa MF-IS2 TaxID=1400762 RepID=A0A9P5XA55_9AGAR|nr:hypothetical protein P691DRAFT_674052 [Macrolepiota fuliginosa MF-IS2]